MCTILHEDSKYTWANKSTSGVQNQLLLFDLASGYCSIETSTTPKASQAFRQFYARLFQEAQLNLVQKQKNTT